VLQALSELARLVFSSKSVHCGQEDGEAARALRLGSIAMEEVIDQAEIK
jgi:hypothetical protein